ncbi:MAG: hypothetical protein ACE5HD_09265 [Acidobacteriota bacterium]
MSAHRAGSGRLPWVVLALLVPFAIPALLLAGEGRDFPDVPALSRSVERLRGLRFREPVQVGRLEPLAFRTRIMKAMRTETDEAEREGLRRALVAFGLIPPTLDLDALLTELLTERVAGFYDPEEKKLFLTRSSQEKVAVPFVDVRMDDLVLVHELAHALDDQHFDLTMLRDSSGSADDATVAFQALEEGTATLTMILYLLEKLGIDIQPANLPLKLLGLFQDPSLLPAGSALADAPEALRRALIFPYTAGLEFVAFHLNHGGWERINAFLAHPPVSSEQILHPAKVLGEGDQPIPVQLDALPVKGLRRLQDGTLGEVDIVSVLQVGMKEERARRGAAGWGGDRFVLFEQGRHDPDLLVWLTVWDVGVEAKEFEDLYIEVMDHRFPRGKSSRPPETPFYLHTYRGHQVLVERRDRRVLIVQGARRRRLERLREAAWDHLKHRSPEES